MSILTENYPAINSNLSKIGVERAIEDLKRGLPIILESQKNYLIFSVETSDVSFFKGGNLIISRSRAEFLFNRKLDNHINIEGEVSEEFKDKLCSSLKPINGFEVKNIISPDSNVIINLLHISELMPFAYVVEIKDQHINNLQTINVNDIESFAARQAESFYIATKADLVLKDISKSSIIAFRAKYSNKEHFAIVIGKIDEDVAPLVRVHSSCYTGDLLDSLACDCGLQLRTALKMMDQQGGGILIYLLQEGRGIGLINKIRTYNAQSHGFDTVEANHVLGFEDDQRDFDVAAAILKVMKIKEIKLITNNPKKSESLTKLGVHVKENVPIITEFNEHNHHYMQTKINKMGHKI